MKWIHSKANRVAAPVIVFFLLFGLWELAVRTFDIPRQVLPTPSSIAAALAGNFELLWPHLLITLKTILTGVIIGVPVGIVLAAVLSQFKMLEKAFSPYVIFLVTTPTITIVPLLTLWLGFGAEVRMLVVVIQAIPIVMLNSITGFNSVDPEPVELMKSLGAGRFATFRKVIFPAALPQVFTGIKLGAIFGTIAAIGSEFAGAKEGMGNRIVSFLALVQTELAFAGIIVVILIGVLLSYLIDLIGSRFLKWNH